MIFRQTIHDDLGCASYLIGDEEAGVAAVVDPRLEISGYLEVAAYFGVSIQHVLETHNHADHVSGHGRLVAATGATIYIHRLAAPDYDHVPIDDGFELDLGRLLVRAMHTPGHRPEHTAFVLVDRDRGAEPWAVLTGDSLFVNDVARPDLAIEERAGARAIYHSIQDTLLSLPDSCELWPAHLGGSMCGGPGMDMKISSTIGFERRHNPTLSIHDEDAFVEQAVAELGPQPPNFRAIVALNKGALSEAVSTASALAPHQIESKRSAGALIVDTRTDRQFDDGHIPGAVCISMLSPGFGSKLAWVAEPDQEVVLVGRDDRDGILAGELALAVGVAKLGGYLTGGMTTWSLEGRETDRIDRLELDELERLAGAREGLQILDVRERSEWDAGHISGSTFAAWHDIDRLPAELDRAEPIAVICASGERAAVGASLLKRYGATDVFHVVGGGVPDWRARGRPIVEGS